MVGLAVAPPFASGAASSSAPAGPTRPHAPAWIEPNVGQVSARYDAVARAATVVASLSGRSIAFRAAGRGAHSSMPAGVDIEFSGAEQTLPPVFLTRLGGVVHAYLGDDPAAWRAGAPTFASLTYPGLYPGIDLLVDTASGRLEYTFVVAPEADPSAIGMRPSAPAALEAGRLVVPVASGRLTLSAPRAWQEADGRRRDVDVAYALDGGTVRFRLGPVDARLPLLIDPVVGFSTHLGGSGFDAAYGLADRADEAIYLTGLTWSDDLPGASGPAGRGDAFVTKLREDGNLLWSAYLGGRGHDIGFSAAAIPGGGVQVAGSTSSPDFPRQESGPPLRGPMDAFTARFRSSGELVWSTLVGGSSIDTGTAIALDASGRSFVAGTTRSPDFAGGASPGAEDAFVAAFDADGAALWRSSDWTVEDESLPSVAASPSTVFLAGTRTPRIAQPLGRGTSAFVASLSSSDGSRGSLHEIDGAGDDYVHALAVGPDGAPVVAGRTSSRDWPTLAPIQRVYGGGFSDAFVTKLSPGLDQRVWSTLFGGSREEIGEAIVAGQDGVLWLAGTTFSRDMPVVCPTQRGNGGVDDIFVVGLDPAGGLVFGTYLGGSSEDVGWGVATRLGGIVVAGSTASEDFPVHSAAQSSHGGGGYDGVVASIDTSCGVDTDDDGLPDAEEVARGVDPGSADTDGDGLADGLEVWGWLTRPDRSDTDGDTLTDAQEVFVSGTSPRHPDSDGDLHSDGAEVASGSDPRSPCSIPGPAGPVTLLVCPV